MTGVLCLTGLCLGLNLSTVAQTSQNQTTKVGKLSPSSRHFLHDWQHCKTAAVDAERQVTKGHTPQAPTDERVLKLQDRFGLQLLPAAYKTAGTLATSANSAQVAAHAYAFYVPAFVSFENEEALQEATLHGLIIQNKLKTIATALVLPDSIEAVARIGQISRINVASKMQVSMDSARIKTLVPSVHQGGIRYGEENNHVSLPYKGEGVVVGIVDIGFDYTHPTFFDADDTTRYRVKRVWDQNTTTSGSLQSPADYNYGVEYTTTEQILAAEHCMRTDLSHGSHVAGIAGGSGAGTLYTGMAPKSDLVFVSTTMYDAGIFDGICYILNYAKKQNKPCVINLSICGHVGPHDGTSDFDRACDELKQNGFVLVGGAGNDGYHPIYLPHTFTANSADTIVKSFIDAGSDAFCLDMWSDNSDDFIASLRLIDKNGQPQATVSLSSDSDTGYYQNLFLGRDTLCRVYTAAEHNSANQKARIYFEMYPDNWNSNYQLGILLQSKNTKKTMSTQMWVYRSSFYGDYTDDTKPGLTNHTMGEIGGTGKSIISTGAYVSRTSEYSSYISGDIAGFSSRGPTADGRMKPDITAPGSALVSAYNSFGPPGSEVLAVKRNGKTYYFGLMQGTSMASPSAAGIIALWLQVDSSLNVDSVKQILQATAITPPDADRPDAAYTWGYGKINAKSGISYLLKKKNGLPATPDPEAMTLSTNAATRITDSSATLYLTKTAGEGHNFGFYYHNSTDVLSGCSVAAVRNGNGNVYSAAIQSLQANQYYHFKAFGLQTQYGITDTVWGETMRFRTLRSTKPTSLEANLAAGELKVYPNPVAKDGEFVVELPLEAGLGGAASASGASGVSGTATYVLTIANLSGQTVQTLPMNQRQTIVRGLESGVYLLQVESRKSGIESTKVYRAKVVVQ